MLFKISIKNFRVVLWIVQKIEEYSYYTSSII